MHVYNWKGRQRLPLSDAMEEWESYFKLTEAENCYLEFVRGDDETAFFEDAKCLAELIGG